MHQKKTEKTDRYQRFILLFIVVILLSYALEHTLHTFSLHDAYFLHHGIGARIAIQMRNKHNDQLRYSLHSTLILRV